MAHDHPHSHDHHHAPENWNKAFAVGIFLNFVFVLVEAFYGYLSHSLALLADAGHNLGDVLGLALALGAILLAKKKPSQKFTYGYGSSTILASLINATVLMIAVGGICVEAIQRFQSPTPINSNLVILVASIGILINGLTAAMFYSSKSRDLNIRAAFLHMFADALISLGVVIAAILIKRSGWHWLDSVASIIISLIIVWSTWKLLKDAASLAMDAVPSHIHIEDVKQFLEKTPGVSHAHHLHIWALSTTDVALTAHLVTPGGHPGNLFLKNISDQLKKKFHIEHATLQIETDESLESCDSMHHE